MKGLVVGGTGYIGSIVVQKLLELGMDISVISRGNLSPMWVDRVTHIQEDRDSLKKLNSSYDFVIDFIGYQLHDVKTVCNFVGSRVNQYLFLSSTSAYDTTDLRIHLGEPVKESDVDVRQIEYSEVALPSYAQGKRDCEKYLLSNPKIHSTIFRSPMVFGPDEPKNRIWWWIQRVSDGQPILVPNAYTDRFQFSYLHDLCDAIVKCCGNVKALNETFNIANPEVFELNSWVNALNTVSGTQSSLVWLDQSEIESVVGEYRMPMYSYQPYTFDTSHIRNTVNWIATPCSEWLSTTFGWYSHFYHGSDSPGYENREREIALAMKNLAAGDQKN